MIYIGIKYHYLIKTWTFFWPNPCVWWIHTWIAHHNPHVDSKHARGCSDDLWLIYSKRHKLWHIHILCDSIHSWSKLMIKGRDSRKPARVFEVKNTYKHGRKQMYFFPKIGKSLDAWNAYSPWVCASTWRWEVSIKWAQNTLQISNHLLYLADQTQTSDRWTLILLLCTALPTELPRVNNPKILEINITLLMC